MLQVRVNPAVMCEERRSTTQRATGRDEDVQRMVAKGAVKDDKDVCERQERYWKQELHAAREETRRVKNRKKKAKREKWKRAVNSHVCVFFFHGCRSRR